MSRASSSPDLQTTTLVCVTDIPARDLRNDVSGVLRRVAAGERFRVTVLGRPVAELVPLPRRPMTWEAFAEDIGYWRADPQLAHDLASLLPDTTDDLPGMCPA